MKRLGMIIWLVLGLSVLAGCGEKGGGGAGRLERHVVEGIRTAVVSSSPARDYYETTGTLKAVNTSMVAAKVMGVATTIHVKEGQSVKKGDILLEISSPDINAKVRAAREGVEEALRGVKMAEEGKKLAEATFERFKALYEERAVSEQEFDEVKTRKRLAVLRYEQALQGLGRAKAMLEEAESFLGYTVIRSPLDGMVAAKMIDIGSMTAPGTPLFVVEGGSYLVETPVNESMIGRIEEGMTVDLSIDSVGLTTTGRVTTVVRRVDPLTRTFIVKVRPDDGSEGFRGGLFARVSFPVGESPRVLVPLEAVVKRGQMRGVYVVDGKGILALRFVRTGKEADGKVEILSGLDEGEMIVVSGTEKAVDGGLIAKE